MNIQEFYDSIDESYENVSSRMMGNQKLVEKFVRKFQIILLMNRLKKQQIRWIMMKFFEQLIR